jgi:hypothetical protein
MYKNRKFLYESGRILNEKMMPDVSAMVPEYEMQHKYKKSTFPEKCSGTKHVSYSL